MHSSEKGGFLCNKTICQLKQLKHNNFQSKIIYTETSVKLKDEKEL